MDKPPLNYMPIKKSRRAPMWRKFGVPSAAVAAVLGGVLLQFGYGFPLHVRVILGVTILVFGGAAAYCFILWKRAWEYRLDDRTLEFRRPLDSGWANIQLDQIMGVCRIEDAENNWWYEIVFRNDQRVRIEKWVFGAWADFQRALLSVRPEIDFTYRRANKCPSCHGDLNARNLVAMYGEFGSDRCDMCGARLGSPLQRIRSGGVVLPEGLNS